MTDNETILKAKGIARQLSYNDPIYGEAKAILHELCHRLDAWQRKPIKRAVRLWRQSLERRIRRLFRRRK